MLEARNVVNQTELDAFMQNAMYNVIPLKFEMVENDIQTLSNRITEIENENFWQTETAGTKMTRTGQWYRPQYRKTPNFDKTDEAEDCKKISERALEILKEWEESYSIKTQVQYAAVIIGKIDKIKKIEFIQSDETRKKICTLLRNVIRLNIVDRIYEKNEIDLLKKGFALLVSDHICKEDMLQLNRDFRRESLMTMPAWE